MVDGILDLLTAILVLGVVLAIAFGFILPLSNNDLMQYNSSYNDKAMMSETTIYDPESFTSESIKKYSYEEMVLLLAVQDNRMDEPKTLNLRNMINFIDLSVYDNMSNNLLNINNIYHLDYVANAIAMGGENHGAIVEGSFKSPSKENVGNILFTSDYTQLVTDNIADYMNQEGILKEPKDPNDPDYSIAKEKYDSYIKTKNDEYYITYLYAIPDDMKVVKNNPNLQANFDDKETYMVQSVEKKSEEEYYNHFIKPIKETLNASNSGKG